MSVQEWSGLAIAALYMALAVMWWTENRRANHWHKSYERERELFADLQQAALRLCATVVDNDRRLPTRVEFHFTVDGLAGCEVIDVPRPCSLCDALIAATMMFCDRASSLNAELNYGKLDIWHQRQVSHRDHVEPTIEAIWRAL